VTPRQTDSSAAPAEEAINQAAVGTTDDQQHES
jgi:hypothetical protein